MNKSVQLKKKGKSVKPAIQNDPHGKQHSVRFKQSIEQLIVKKAQQLSSTEGKLIGFSEVIQRATERFVKAK